MDDVATKDNAALQKCLQRDEDDRRIKSETAKRFETKLSAKRALRRYLERIEQTRAQGPHFGASIFGSGYAGFGNSWTDGKPRIVYPKERKRPRRHLQEIAWRQDELNAAALKSAVLVPIRLDLDYDKYKLRDTLTWDLNDTTIPLTLFAEHLCEDYHLPQVGFVNDIVKSLQTQLSDFHPHKFPASEETSHQQPSSIEDEDLRIAIKLDITVGAFNLTDQFEWDLNNPINDIDFFAHALVIELGLSSEFESAIAHSIREQCQMYTKTLFLVGYSFDGQAVEDNDVRQFIAPQLQTHTRPRHLQDRYSPLLQELNAEQLERIDKEREREGRRNRRQTRGKRGTNLPELTDLPKTYRTPYANNVLIPTDQQWTDRFGSIRTRVPGTMDGEDESENDDRSEEYHGREHGDRSSRAARRSNHANASTNSLTSQDFSASRDHPSHNLHRQMYQGNVLPRRELDRPSVTSSESRHLSQRPYALPSYLEESPPPSLILKLKVPGIRKLFMR